MKNIWIALLIAATLSAGSGHAQDTSRVRRTERNDEDDYQGYADTAARPRHHARKPSHMRIFSIEAGLNMASLAFQNYAPNYAGSYVPGLRAGFCIETRLAGRVYLEEGVYFSQNGVSATPPDADFPNTETLHIESLEVPLCLEYRSHDNGRRRFFAGGGGFVGWNFGGTLSNTNQYLPDRTLHIGPNDTDDIQAIDAGICGTLGYVSHGGLLLRLRAQKGLVNLCPQAGSAIYSSSFGLSVGYLFRTQKRRPRQSDADADVEMKM